MKTVDEVIEFIRRHQGTSFIEIHKFINDPGGTIGICAPDRPNTLLWTGFSEKGADLVSDVLSDDRVSLDPCHYLVYLVDGALLNLPIAKRPSKDHDYKKEHWLPVTLSVSKLGATLPDGD